MRYITPLKTEEGFLALEAHKEVECLNHSLTSVVTHKRLNDMPTTGREAVVEKINGMTLGYINLEKETKKKKSEKSSELDKINAQVIFF